LQADAAIQNFCQKFGVEAALTEDGELIIKHSERYQDSIEHDFILHPDLTQTIAAICAAKGISIKYRGLKTLYIKETDRVAALRQELRKTGVTWAESKDEGWEYIQHGKVVIDEPIFDTYEDHRMAMCLAPLGYLSEVSIRNPEVVSKSYPRYWDDLESLGFKISYLSSDDLF